MSDTEDPFGYTPVSMPAGAHTLEQAQEAYRQGEYEIALHGFAALLASADSPEALEGRVRCLIHLERFQDARTWAARGTANFPTSSRLTSVLALCLAHCGRLEEAALQSDRALTLGREAGGVADDLWLDRGATLLMTGEPEAAASSFRHGLEARPNDADLLQTVGLAFLEAKRPDRARPYFLAALQQCAGSPYLHVLAARTARMAKDRAGALELLEKARAIRPHYPLAEKELEALSKERPCWIATCVFGDPAHPVVAALRHWRDRRWMRHPAGRQAAAFYDRTAPLLCRVLARLPFCAAPLRGVLGWVARRVGASR